MPRLRRSDNVAEMPPTLPPDFLWDLAASANFMRLLYGKAHTQLWLVLRGRKSWYRAGLTFGDRPYGPRRGEFRKRYILAGAWGDRANQGTPSSTSLTHSTQFSPEDVTTPLPLLQLL